MSDTAQDLPVIEYFLHVGGLYVSWNPRDNTASYRSPKESRPKIVMVSRETRDVMVRIKQWYEKKNYGFIHRESSAWKKVAQKKGLFVLNHQTFLLAQTVEGNPAGFFDRDDGIGSLIFNVHESGPDFPVPKLS